MRGEPRSRARLPGLNIVVALGAFAAFAFVIHSRLQAPADADSFYHIRHAWLYRQGGWFQTAFPWVQYSAIKTYAADLWYGFHVLLLPLTSLDDLVKGLYIGAYVTTVVALGLVYLAVRTLELRWPVLWVFVFTLASADVLYRLTMLRPHPLSIGLTLALFSYLVTGGSMRRLVAAFLLSGVLAWIHLALSWIAVLVAVVVTLVRAVHGRTPDWPALACVGSGLLTGWLLRPNPVGAAKLVYIQVVKLLLEKQEHTPLSFGVELYPFAWLNFADQLIPLTVLTVVALGYLVWLIARKRSRTLAPTLQIALWSSVILCAGFFLLTFTIARRSNEIFVGFAVMFTGLLATHYRAGRRADRRQSLALGLVALALLAMTLRTLSRFETYADVAATAYRPDRFKAVSLWLEKHARPGEIVFNVHWGMFPHLFFWNTSSYYISGMDPIFQYAYDPGLYWKNHFLAFAGATNFTCASTKCTGAESIETHGVLKRDFHASYVLIEKLGQPELYRYLAGDARFMKILETGDDALFRIL